jgi:hypothetical protein
VQTATRPPRPLGWRAARRCSPLRLQAGGPGPSRPAPHMAVQPLAAAAADGELAMLRRSLPDVTVAVFPCVRRERDQLQYVARGGPQAPQAQSAAGGLAGRGASIRCLHPTPVGVGIFESCKHSCTPSRTGPPCLAAPLSLQAVAALLQQDTSAVVTLKSSGIDRPAKVRQGWTNLPCLRVLLVALLRQPGWQVPTPCPSSASLAKCRERGQHEWRGKASRLPCPPLPHDTLHCKGSAAVLPPCSWRASGTLPTPHGTRAASCSR